MKEGGMEKRPYQYQSSRQSRTLFDNPKSSKGSIQSSRMPADLELEMSQLRYELSTYQKHYQDLEMELGDWKSREEHYVKENLRYQEQAVLLEQELYECNKLRQQLKEELKHSKDVIEKERGQKMDMLDKLIIKEKQAQHFQDAIKQLDSKEQFKKDNLQIQTKKNMDEELNRFKNELQYKFSQKEKKYKSIIEQLQSGQTLEQEQFALSNSSTKNSKWNELQRSSFTPKDKPNPLEQEVKKLLKLTYASNLSECMSKVENIVEELSSYYQITERLSQQLGIQGDQQYPSSQQLILLLDHLQTLINSYQQ